MTRRDAKGHNGEEAGNKTGSRSHLLWDVESSRGVAFPDVSFVPDTATYWTAMALLRMLSSMRYPRLWGVRAAAAWCAVAVSTGSVWLQKASAQTCVTQSRMTPAQRTEIGSAAFALASAVLAGDAARVRASTVAQYAGDFNQTAYLVQSTASRIAGDTLAVTQAYLLDASARTAGESTPADFACALAGSVSETDFSIPGLPAGRFAFVMVEARGANPWLLAFLLQQDAGAWKMAGFYPHERAAAGHDGLWYWTTARADDKAAKPWLAWLLYSEADQLLRPASFISSGNLDKLRNEQRAAAPEPLSNGLSAQTPLALLGANGTEYRVTSLTAQGADGGKALNLVMHIQGEPGATGQTSTARNIAAASALLTAHPELRQGFDNIWVIADVPGSSPFVVQKPLSEIVAVSK